MMRIGQSLTFALAMAASAVFAAPPQPVEQHNSNALWFENWNGLSNATLTVVAPGGEISEIFTAKGTPVYKLGGEKLEDGIYRYELSAATEEREKIVNKVNNGRGDKAREERAVPFFLEGSFTVYRGVIITPKELDEADFKVEPEEPGKDIESKDGDEGESKPPEDPIKEPDGKDSDEG